MQGIVDARVLTGLLVATAILLLVQTVRLRWEPWWRRHRLTRRRRRAARGERNAEQLLVAAGYRVEGRQVGGALEYGLGAIPVAVSVRADLVVSRGHLRYVAEVKTGAEARELRTIATRRQLLEYAHAFDVDGVLLVDPERGLVHEVALPTRGQAAKPRATLARDVTLLAVGALVGAVAAIAWFAPR